MKVQFTDGEVAMMQSALDRWGLNAQVGQTVEECAELIVALQKYVNRPSHPETIDNILDEIADVEMMLSQMRLILGISDETLRKRIECKFERLRKYLLEDDFMNCQNTKKCACPQTSCPRHKNCCACIVNHRETDSLPFCMFPDNDGDKSMESLYRKLKERFEA